MKASLKITSLIAIFLATLSSCGGSGSDGGEKNSNVESNVYSATLTNLELTKKGSTERLLVDNLPAESAQITVNQ